MCGRFTIGEIKDLITRFSIDAPVADMPRPRYNLAPTQDAPVVVGGGHNRLVMMRWGLIPFWAKDPRIGSRMINARAESVTMRPAFRASIKDRRCLVPTTGFYEWKRVDGKAPYLVRSRDERIFAMAGLYDRWKDPSGTDILSFTIITTAANELMSSIHDRMPVILRREDEERWLEAGPLEARTMEGLFRPFPSEWMEAYPVSKMVNDLSKDSEELMRPLPQAGASGWF